MFNKKVFVHHEECSIKKIYILFLVQPSLQVNKMYIFWFELTDKIESPKNHSKRSKNILRTK